MNECHVCLGDDTPGVLGGAVLLPGQVPLRVPSAAPQHQPGPRTYQDFRCIPRAGHASFFVNLSHVAASCCFIRRCFDDIFPRVITVSRHVSSFFKLILKEFPHLKFSPLNLSNSSLSVMWSSSTPAGIQYHPSHTAVMSAGSQTHPSPLQPANILQLC